MAEDHTSPPDVDIDDLKTESPPDAAESESWTLTVTGAVEHPLTLRREEVQRLAEEIDDPERTAIDGWNGDGRHWKGVRMDDLLERAHPQTEAEFALVQAMDDGFACSFHLDRFEEALLAIELDGEPVPSDRGGPARLLVADDGADCWESVKWVADVEIHTSEPTEADTSERLARAHEE